MVKTGVSVCDKAVSTHSRLKAAGRIEQLMAICVQVSTHSRLKAAGRGDEQLFWYVQLFQHTAA